MIDQPLMNNIPEGEGFLFPENSYSGTCQCGQEYLAPKGVIHCHMCLYERIKLLDKEREAYKEILLYCKHNKTGQGAKINGVLWEWSDDL